jgi:hypothetical protein
MTTLVMSPGLSDSKRSRPAAENADSIFAAFSEARHTATALSRARAVHTSIQVRFVFEKKAELVATTTLSASNVQVVLRYRVKN